MALTDNLIAFWEFEDNANDAHGSNNLTENASPTYSASGRVNKAIDLELSSSQYLSLADNSDMSLGADVAFSWQFWVNPESSAASHVLAQKGTGSANTAQEYLIRLNSDNTIRLVVSDGSANVSLDSTDTCPDGSFSHVVAGHDPDNDEVFIIINDGTPATASYSDGTQDTSGQLTIGRRADTAADYFDGLIDQVGFWKKVLSGAEIEQLYNSGSGMSYAAMLGMAATLTMTGALTGDIAAVKYPVFSSAITRTKFASKATGE